MKRQPFWIKGDDDAGYFTLYFAREFVDWIVGFVCGGRLGVSMKLKTYCQEEHTLFQISEDRLKCAQCPWHVLFTELPRWIYTVGRMMMKANQGLSRRESQRDALIENYTKWAEEHGRSNSVSRIVSALEKTT